MTHTSYPSSLNDSAPRYRCHIGAVRPHAGAGGEGGGKIAVKVGWTYCA